MEEYLQQIPTDLVQSVNRSTARDRTSTKLYIQHNEVTICHRYVIPSSVQRKQEEDEMQ